MVRWDRLGWVFLFFIPVLWQGEIAQSSTFFLENYGMAVFINIILLAAFLGLGLGCLTTRRLFNLAPWLPLALFVVIGCGHGFAYLPITAQQEGEHFLGFYARGGVSYLAVVAVVFTLSALLFVILGQILGRLFQRFHPITAYSINIVGSLAGILSFWFVSVLRMSPLVWFGIAMLLSLRFLWFTRRGLTVAVVVFLMTLVMIGGSARAYLWSPYSMISVDKLADKAGLIGFSISANQTYHQDALDFSKPANFSEKLQYARISYEFPYRFITPRSVMVVGAGSGNDVAIALQQGVERVDAVEIDPVLADMGTWLHPQRPYLDPRVKVMGHPAFLWATTTGCMIDRMDE